MTRIYLPAIFSLTLALSCEVEPEPLPTKKAVELLPRDSQPPLYQMLYDSPVLPASKPQQQKVRMLIWLLHMELSKDQLKRLDALHTLVEERRDALSETERKIIETYESEENQVYEQLWLELMEGTELTDPKMDEIVGQMTQLKAGGERALTGCRLGE